MKLLLGFSVLSLLSGLVLMVLPDTPLKKTAHLMLSLLLLFFWLTSLHDVFTTHAISGEFAFPSIWSSSGYTLPDTSALQEESP